jgi:ferredoxin--NADP+ reductase
MFKIVEKKVLSPSVKQFAVAAPQIAKKCHPGQFVIIRIDEDGERLPLTIADFDCDRGTITLLFQEVGASTQQLGKLEEGDSILDVAGPLGKPTNIKNLGIVVCIGGGIGTAPVYPIARAMRAAGNRVISIIGARTEELLIFVDEMKNVSDELYITTDDGSKGIKGFVTDVLKRLIDDGEKIAEVLAIGPVVMMRGVAEVTRPYRIPTVVSLNPIMVDGTGMCGGCRVAVGDETKFACVDGPEFDAHQVDFASLIARQKMYIPLEKVSCQQGRGECKCH